MYSAVNSVLRKCKKFAFGIAPIVFMPRHITLRMRSITSHQTEFWILQLWHDHGTDKI